jgi:hypothetical protein
MQARMYFDDGSTETGSVYARLPGGDSLLEGIAQPYNTANRGELPDSSEQPNS